MFLLPLPSRRFKGQRIPKPSILVFESSLDPWLLRLFYSTGQQRRDFILASSPQLGSTKNAVIPCLPTIRTWGCPTWVGAA